MNQDFQPKIARPLNITRAQSWLIVMLWCFFLLFYCRQDESSSRLLYRLAIWREFANEIFIENDRFFQKVIKIQNGCMPVVILLQNQWYSSLFPDFLWIFPWIAIIFALRRSALARLKDKQWPSFFSGIVLRCCWHTPRFIWTPQYVIYLQVRLH